MDTKSKPVLWPLMLAVVKDVLVNGHLILRNSFYLPKNSGSPLSNSIESKPELKVKLWP
jgi:hypothetical protein